VSRWQPNAQGRLAEAALELFGERGFEHTTVEDISTRAGLTKRTFFRHFADKREVLFTGGDAFASIFLSALADVPDGATPMQAIEGTLLGAARTFTIPHDRARRRQAVIDANPELQERELVKLARVSAALTEAFGARGYDDAVASMAAETAMAVFRIAFGRWVGGHEDADLADVVRESLVALQTVASGRV
jgi:AcrR family transcriptional regulator